MWQGVSRSHGVAVSTIYSDLDFFTGAGELVYDGFHQECIYVCVYIYIYIYTHVYIHFFRRILQAIILVSRVGEIQSLHSICQLNIHTYIYIWSQAPPGPTFCRA